MDWDLGEAEVRDEPFLGLLRGGGTADERDDFVQVVEGDLETLEDVGALAGLPELILGLSDGDLAAVVDEVDERVLDGQDARLPVDDGEEVHAEGRLEPGVLVELI